MKSNTNDDKIRSFVFAYKDIVKLSPAFIDTAGPYDTTSAPIIVILKASETLFPGGASYISIKSSISESPSSVTRAVRTSVYVPGIRFAPVLNVN